MPFQQPEQLGPLRRVPAGCAASRIVSSVRSMTSSSPFLSCVRAVTTAASARCQASSSSTANSAAEQVEARPGRQHAGRPVLQRRRAAAERFPGRGQAGGGPLAVDGARERRVVGVEGVDVVHDRRVSGPLRPGQSHRDGLGEPLLEQRVTSRSLRSSFIRRRKDSVDGRSGCSYSVGTPVPRVELRVEQVEQARKKCSLPRCGVAVSSSRWCARDASSRAAVGTATSG